jgi:putative PIN family toxin of toxin-antitoxin system
LDKPRVVLDANVVVSALLSSSGAPARVLCAFLAEQAFEVVTSPAVLAELRRVLAYPKIRSRLGWDDPAIERFVVSWEALAVVVSGDGSTPPLPADPDDAIYLAAALEGDAAVVVSGDNHLLELGTLDRIRIMRPAEFVAERLAVR